MTLALAIWGGAVLVAGVSFLGGWQIHAALCTVRIKTPVAAAQALYARPQDIIAISVAERLSDDEHARLHARLKAMAGQRVVLYHGLRADIGGVCKPGPEGAEETPRVWDASTKPWTPLSVNPWSRL